MRKLIFTLTSFLFFISSGYSQNSNYVRKFPNRYELDLPVEWTTTPKLIRAVTEILPKTLDVLKDKEFCIDCKAGYTIKLVVDMPYIKSRNNISKGIERSKSYYSMEVVYQFRAALELYDSSGKNIIDLVLVLPEEEHIKRKDTTAYSIGYSGPQVIKDINGYPVKTVWIPGINSIPISNNLAPTLYDLIAIAEQRVYSIRDILLKIE